MAFIGGLGRAALSFLTVFAAAVVCRADDCGPTAYAYEDRVVLFTCGKSGTPELHVILLEDGSALKTTGRVSSTARRSFDAAMHYNNFLLVVTWDNLEIYDLSAPTHPSLAAKFQLKKQEQLPGYPRIEKTAENKFLVISAIGATEVTAEGAARDWTLKETPVTEEMRKKMSARPPESRFRDENEQAVVVRESPQFRYELIWKDRKKQGQINHQQYLRKVDKASQQAASELPLGGRLETID